MNTFDKEHSNDHDTLIRVETKVDQLVNDLKSLSDGIFTRLIKAEGRLDQIEVYHAAHPLGVWEENSLWLVGFRANLKFIVVFITFIATILSGLIVLMLKSIFRF